MIRNAMFTVAFGACALGAAALFAQESTEAEAQPLRFEPMVRVLNLERDADAAPGATLRVKAPGGTAREAVAYKAYPYGSTFEADEGVRFRVGFSNLTYAVVRGPARFTPKAADEWRKVTLEAQLGDYNLRVDDRSLPGQFEIATPLGTFTDMAGMARLHLGKDLAANETVGEEDFSFRTLSGNAVFKGLHYTMSGMTQANAFASADTQGFVTSELTGRLGEVKMELPMGGNNAPTPFSLTPGAQVKITRAKPKGSDNWVVSVLTLYANGQAQNYFCYVEGRGEGFATGELLAEVLPPEPEEGDLLDGEGDLGGDLGGGDDAFDDASLGDLPDEMTDFDDGALL